MSLAAKAPNSIFDCFPICYLGKMLIIIPAILRDGEALSLGLYLTEVHLAMFTSAPKHVILYLKPVVLLVYFGFTCFILFYFCLNKHLVSLRKVSLGFKSQSGLGDLEALQVSIFASAMCQW